MEKKKQGMIVTSILLVSLVFVVIGVSFAFFTYSRQGSKENTITTGSLTFVYDEQKAEGNGITLSNAFPMSDEDGKAQSGDNNVFDFQVLANTQGESIAYEVIGKKDDSSTLPDNVVKIYLTTLSGSEESEVVTTVKDGVVTTYDELSDTQIKEQTGKTLYQEVIPLNQTGYQKNFRLRMWLSEEANTTTNGSWDYNNKTFTIRINVVANGEGQPIYQDESGANVPELVEGMIPVTYDEENKSWIKADTSSKWYDYNNQEWANAVTVTEANRATYMSAEAGTVIPMEDINTMWTWIPRYSYTIYHNPFPNVGLNKFHSKSTSTFHMKFTPAADGTITMDVTYDNSLLDANGTVTINDTTLLELAYNSPTTSKIEYSVKANTEYTLTFSHYMHMELSTSDYWMLIHNIHLDVPLAKEVTLENDSTYPWEISYDTNGKGENNDSTVSVNSPGAIDIKFVDVNTKETGTAQYTENEASNWRTSDGFTFDDRELSGLWYAKFETGGTLVSACTNESCDTSNVVIKPNVISLRNQNISSFFYMVRSMQMNANNPYGFRSTSGNVHMSKNSEWGAVAYLSQSKYGKYGNSNYTGVDKEVAINNCNSYMTGIGGDTVSASSSDTTCTTNTYETKKGQSASTTGNITGVYDMSGGTWEFVMGNYNTSKGDAEFDNLPEAKYYDLYTTTSATTSCDGGICYGHALSETAGWYQDYQNFISNHYPWFIRGGAFYHTTTAGVFGFNIDSGQSNTTPTVRAVLVLGAE